MFKLILVSALIAHPEKIIIMLLQLHDHQSHDLPCTTVYPRQDKQVAHSKLSSPSIPPTHNLEL